MDFCGRKDWNGGCDDGWVDWALRMVSSYDHWGWRRGGRVKGMEEQLCEVKWEKKKSETRIAEKDVSYMKVRDADEKKRTLKEGRTSKGKGEERRGVWERNEKSKKVARRVVKRIADECVSGKLLTSVTWNTREINKREELEERCENCQMQEWMDRREGEMRERGIVVNSGLRFMRMGESGMGQWGSGEELYITLPLVFPPESGGPPKSHCSPGKVWHSCCSPGGIW